MFLIFQNFNNVLNSLYITALFGLRVPRSRLRLPFFFFWLAPLALFMGHEQCIKQSYSVKRVNSVAEIIFLLFSVFSKISSIQTHTYWQCRILALTPFMLNINNIMFYDFEKEYKISWNFEKQFFSNFMVF